jgi:hypothetical protein
MAWLNIQSSKTSILKPLLDMLQAQEGGLSDLQLRQMLARSIEGRIPILASPHLVTLLE